jgi:phage-related tail fiber protein
MIPEEDRGPAWLRDYGFTDFGNIAADINAMAEYAAKLAADVEANYNPHYDGLAATFDTELPPAHEGFYELQSFMESHKAALAATSENVYAFGQGTTVFATAAREISDDYRGSDAFAHATVKDVRETLTPGAPTASTQGER